jgi:hypothetical protein
VVKLEVGKCSVVLYLGQGTTSREKGVTRISPSNPRPGGEISTGTLPKFRVLETPAEGMTGNAEEVNGVSKEEMESYQKYLVQQ